MKPYDCIIVGGGPAGLSAAVYVVRFNRSVLVFDRGGGRWSTHEINENYLGFPHGIATKKLEQLGVEQALRFGAEIKHEEVIHVNQKNGEFSVQTKGNSYISKSIILATGVTDDFSHVEKWKEYLGKSLFVCITCDGYKTKGKRIAIIGHDDDAACTAMQFLNYTKQVIFITNRKSGEDLLSIHARKILQEAAIPLFEDVISHVRGSDGILQSVVLTDGEEIPLDYLFSEQGKTPNILLAKELSLNLDAGGYIITDTEQRTNIPFVYAAGDVTKMFAHQVGTAVHEGSAAAQAANYDLYTPEQRF